MKKEIVHPDGFRAPMEMTQLPLIDGRTGAWLVLGLVEGLSQEYSGDSTFYIENQDTEYFFTA